MRATRVGPNRIIDHQIDQVTWSLDTPITFTKYTWNGTDYDQSVLETDHVVTSASTNGVYETYIFPADSTGKILSFGELPGSKQGILDHDHVIAAFCEHYSKPALPHSSM